MIALLDVNVLVALAWPNHVHHPAAHRFFEQQQASGWATCPLTQSGFARISSNSRILQDARTPIEAIALLRQIIALPGHHFWADDLSIADSTFVAHDRIIGSAQVTDAHLLGLALRRSGLLATFDRGILEILPQGVDAEQAVHLLRA